MFFRITLLTALMLALSTIAFADPLVVVRQAAGASPADIQAAVDAFRSDLGGSNNGAGGSFATGRREITWDGLPDNFASPNNMPADFFNVNSPRGAVFSTPGTGFQVSARSSSGNPILFGNINPTYPNIFRAFSPERIFTPLGSNITDVTFFVPGTSTPALVSGFGAVFTNVTLANTTKIELFGIDGALLFSGFVPAATGPQSFSFLGASLDLPLVARVRITTGNAALGPNNNNGGGTNIVAMDDFIYGEPQAVPEPSTLALLLGGAGPVLGWLGWRRRSKL